MNKDYLRAIFSSEKIQTIAQFILGGIFIYASFGKIFFREDFLIAIQNYKLLPGSLETILSYILPWIEFTLGALLVLDMYPRKAAIGLSGLLCIFIIAIFISMVRGIDLGCGCFFETLNQPEYEKSDHVLLILRDLLILVPGIILIVYSRPVRI